MKLRVQLVKELDDDGKQEQIIDQFETDDIDLLPAAHREESPTVSEELFDRTRDHFEKEFQLELFEVD